MENKNLADARSAKNDEFYTRYEDIQNEINAYWEYDANVFRNKTVLCPCDDPEQSNFTKFFIRNFERFGLKKLISTCLPCQSEARGAKGKIFTKIGRELAVAVKEGGGPDPANNSRLRDVIAKAKSNNMPNDTIERNIKKAAGEGAGDNYEHITYEGYGPNGTAIIVKTLTDNKNRTASNVRNAFTKGSGNVGTPGCVSFMFDEKGQIFVAKEDCSMDPDELMMLALDAGAEDFTEDEESYEILTDPESFSDVRLKLEEAGIEMASAEVTMIPQTYVELTKEEDIKNIQKTLDLLEEDDDVQDVYHNWSE